MAEVIKSAALAAVTTAEKKIRPGGSQPASEALTRLASSAAGAVDLSTGTGKSCSYITADTAKAAKAAKRTARSRKSRYLTIRA